jgi:L1 cell adhesion molecule like protein
MLKDLFGESKVCSPVHPDEAVAFGAAFQAALVMCPEVTNQSESLLLMDTVPLDIGCETAGGVFTVIIKRNSTIPIKQEQVFTTYADNQPSVTINIYEGTRPMVADNTLLGSFNLDGIPPAPRGVPQIKITCDVDNSGCLKVTARDVNTSNSKELVITDLKGKLSQEDIEKMIADAEKYAESDARQRVRMEKKNQYDSMIFQLKDMATRNNNEAMLNACKEHEQWLINNPEADEETLSQRIKLLEEMMRTAAGAAGAGAPPQGDNNAPSGEGPSVEEVN